jgi:copper chaperone CopZ
MKKLLLIMVLTVVVFLGNAQFSKARLQATGLTCAMCSNAINKALQKLPYVASVQPDIKNSAFDIQFKKEAEVDIAGLRKAVEDAGFFVGGLNLTASFADLKIANEEKVKLGKNNLCFIEVGKQTLNGEKTIKVLNKEYVTAKEFKKFSAATRSRLQQSEREDNGRILHVTI